MSTYSLVDCRWQLMHLPKNFLKGRAHTADQPTKICCSVEFPRKY